MNSLRLLVSLTVLAACGPKQPDQTTDDPATSSTSPDTTTPTTDAPPDPSTSTDPTTPPDPSITASSTLTAGSFTSSPPTTDPSATDPSATDATLSDPTATDTATEPVPCDLSLQDCPEGQKCSVVAMSADDLFQGSFVCVPLDPSPQPPHAACDVFGDPADGTDNCAAGSICLNPDDSGLGECFAFCDFSSDTICSVPGDSCVGATCQTCTWSFCDAACNVLDPAACPADQMCAPTDDGNWLCLPDASGDDGKHGDPCSFVNECDPGFVCMGQFAIPACMSEDGCCTTACDVEAANTCPDKDLGTACKSWYGNVEPPSAELAKVGVCHL